MPLAQRNPKYIQKPGTLVHPNNTYFIYDVPTTVRNTKKKKKKKTIEIIKRERKITQKTITKRERKISKKKNIFISTILKKNFPF